jgi:hypothetical protein
MRLVVFVVVDAVSSVFFFDWLQHLSTFWLTVLMYTLYDSFGSNPQVQWASQKKGYHMILNSYVGNMNTSPNCFVQPLDPP